MASSQTDPLVGVDVGGTFTDFVWMTGDALRVHKVPTSSPQHTAVAAGLSDLDVPDAVPIAHGTTVATNALLERDGARTALLTTEGFADVLAIGRQNRPELYQLSMTRPAPLVPAERRYEVPERLDAEGSVLTPLDEAAVRRIGEELAETDVESVAIVFLFSFQNPSHEERTASIIREECPEMSITRSSALLPEYREYERTATTTINAYVRPKVARYLERLDDAVDERPVRVMQSSGGTIDVKPAAEQAARLVLSGPAGGVVGAFDVARRALDTATPQLITLDMGGTSADVALCDGAIPRTPEHTIADLPLRLPTIDIHTVGAGGGSIARVDAGGSLRVGPDSAGADPGPACYGRGGSDPTVTDAHLTLGRLRPKSFLGSSDDFTLDPDAGLDAVRSMARALDASPAAAAQGILRVANATMERALRRISVERGHDPRDYTLVPFGGAGPLHACALAEALGIRRVLVPPHPGVLSAYGLGTADVVRDAVQAILEPLEALRSDLDTLQSAAGTLTDQIQDALPESSAPQLDAELDVRYAGQSYELTVPLELPVTTDHLADAEADFHDLHAQRYGHADNTATVEVVALRLRGIVSGPDIELPSEPVTEQPLSEAQRGAPDVWFEPDEPTATPIYQRDDLHHGHTFEGPAIVVQYDSTVVVPPGWRATVDAWRNLRIEQ